MLGQGTKLERVYDGVPARTPERTREGGRQNEQVRVTRMERDTRMYRMSYAR